MIKLPLFDNIRLRREALGMTQEELAALSGYRGKSAIARIENGEIDLPAKRIIAIAHALKTTPGKLMDGDIAISPEEISLLANYRDASEESKGNANLILKSSADLNRENDKKAETA